MNKLHLALSLLSISVFSHVSFSEERKLFTAKDASEVRATFQHWVEADSATKPTQKKARQFIELQLYHMFGPLGVAVYPAVPKGEHEISNVKVTSLGLGKYKISYDYEGILLMKNGPKTQYPILLPNNPDTIYEAGMVGDENPCTDHHYQSEGDFWYFWNPANYNCKLKEGRDYTKVMAQIEVLPNSKNTYPEYERLVDENGNIVISILMGMDDPKKGKDPNSSADINASNFRDIKKSLLADGYKNDILTESDIRKWLGVQLQAYPYVEVFTKKSKRANLIVRVSFSPSGINENSRAFHYLYKDALENSSIMMYDGHSGLGGHLDLRAIEDINGFTFQPNPDRYQIYFFNSCSSYTYYNTMYFGRKMTAQDPKGTKNLDILTNGLATYFSVMHPTNLAVVTAVEAWANDKGRLSYKALAEEIDSNNLFGINGDEDND